MRRTALFVGLLGLLLAPSAQAALVTVQYVAHSYGTLDASISDNAITDDAPWTMTPIFSTAADQTANGTFQINSGTLYMLIVQASVLGNETDDHKYLEATFTAPGGYVWSQTQDQFFSTKALLSWPPPGNSLPPEEWMSSGIEPWLEYPDHPSWKGTIVQTAAGTPNPAVYDADAQRIWRALPANAPYFVAEAALEPGSWKLYGDVVGAIDTSLTGLAAQVVRVNSNLDTLAQADTALTRRPGDADYNVAQTFHGISGDIGTVGHYSPSVGQLPGDHQSAGVNPEDYAVKMAGYVYATAGDIRTFAVSGTFPDSGDDGFYFRIGGTGGTEFLRQNDSSDTYLASIQFMNTGYYALELVSRNRAGAQGLEISSIADWTDTFNSSTFKILGTDVDYVVYQNQAGVAAPADLGANHAADPLYEGTISPVADGFRVQQAVPADHGGMAPTSVDSAISFYADKVIDNNDKTLYDVGVVETRGRMAMQDSGGFTGNFARDAMPISGTGSNDNFATRINGLVYIPEAGEYAFTNSSDDGFSLRVGNLEMGKRAGSGATAAGTANYMYAQFDKPGLYPFEYYQYDGTGGSGIEIAHGGSTSLLLPSANPASNGFTVNWSGAPGSPNQVSAYVVEPIAELHQHSINLLGKAYGYVPALGMAVAPEYWKVEQYWPNTQFLRTPDPADPTNIVAGLRAQWFGNRSFDPAQIVFDGVVPEVNRANDVYDPTGWTGTNHDNFQVRYTGQVYAPNDGTYLFREHVDDIARLWIDSTQLLNNGSWDIPTQNSIFLTEGWHDLRFETEEGGGGDYAYLYWDMGRGDGTYDILTSFIDIYKIIAEGTGMIGDLTDEGVFKSFPLDFETTYDLRLTVNVAGLSAIYNLNDVLFVPEPATMLLLGGGLLALARRRRNRR